MIGLDFGTTNSCAAFTDSYLGDVQVASVAPFNTPPYDAVLSSSVLDPLGETPWIGIQAETENQKLKRSEPGEKPFLSNFKRTLNVHRLQKKVRVVDKTWWQYDGLQQIDVERHTYRDKTVGEGYPRETLVGAVTVLLAHLLKSAAEQGAGRDRLLLGTPVAFSARARKRMIAALYQTGLFESYQEIVEITRFIPEPVAAATAGMREAIDTDDRECVLVFDHGGGTLDLSLIEFERRPNFDFLVPTRELAPPAGEDGVAGQAFDYALRNELCVTGGIRRALEALPEYQAIRLIRDVKEQLSTQDEAVLSILEAGVENIVTREMFEIAAAPLLGSIDQQIRRLLLSANRSVADVNRVLLTGGSSLIPCVQDRIRSIFPHLSERGRVRAYDPSDAGDVERAVTEIAQGLALLGGEEADLRRVVMWDIELLDSEGQGFRHVAAAGDDYELDEDGRPQLKKVLPVNDANGDGMALGVWEGRLEKRSFLFGIAEIPPSDGPLQLEVILRPDALYPALRLLDANEAPVVRQDDFGWTENGEVTGDISTLSEGQLGEFFDQDEVDYVPTASFKQFRHAPLTRLIGIGDVVEWVEHRSDGRPPLSRSGEIIAIRELGNHDPLDEVPQFDLSEYELNIRVESTGGHMKVSPPFGTIRVRPTA